MIKIELDEFKNNFDNYLKVVENGESIIIDGEKRILITPTFESSYTSNSNQNCFCDHDDGC